ncbi:hypothetical protein GLOIN_2v1878284 [Rhizophagus clarus]|nr:hypothetical protein GLOIN_2v1878284 [Rhizophagus clarus]
MKNKKKIYGCYNARNFPYHSFDYFSASESFLFCFENNEDKQNMKMNRVKKGYLTSKKGFNFGDIIYMNGRYIYFNNINDDDNVRNILDLDGHQSIRFIPESVEVFKITTT